MRSVIHKHVKVNKLRMGILSSQSTNKSPAELPNKNQEDIQFSNLTTDIKAFYVTNDE